MLCFVVLTIKHLAIQNKNPLFNLALESGLEAPFQPIEMRVEMNNYVMN